MKKRWLIFIKFFVSGVFIAVLYVVLRGEFDKILKIIKGTNVILFVLSFLLASLTIIVISFRLKMLFSIQGISVSLKKATIINFIGLFFNNFIPTSVGGDIVKTYYAVRMTEKRMESFTGIFLDRFFGFLSIFLLAGFSLLLVTDPIATPIYWIILGLLSLSLLVFFMLNSTRIIEKIISVLNRFKYFRKSLDRFHKIIERFRENRRICFLILIISLLGQCLNIVVIFLLSRSICTDVYIGLLFMFIPRILTVSMLPSINGLGIREGAYIYFLGSIMGKDKAFALSLLCLMTSLLLSAVGGIIYILAIKHKTEIEKQFS